MKYCLQVKYQVHDVTMVAEICLVLYRIPACIIWYRPRTSLSCDVQEVPDVFDVLLYNVYANRVAFMRNGSRHDTTTFIPCIKLRSQSHHPQCNITVVATNTSLVLPQVTN